MALVFTPSLDQALDNAGNPLSGAKMYFYLTGTTTLATYYTNGAGTVAGANPLVSNSSGRFAPAFLSSGTTYRVKCTNSTGSITLFDVDPVSSFTPSVYTASLFFATWAQLNAVSGTVVGESAAVFDDAGTHTDSVTSTTVSNEGLYSWTGSAWHWISTLGRVLPSGSDGQVQYNSAGSFAGMSGFSQTGGALSAVSITGGIKTTSSPLIAVTQTWNDAGIAFDATTINITNTSSDYSSTFLKGIVNGADRFKITRDDTFAFGSENGVGAECLLGFRRVSGRLVGIGAQRDASGGKLAHAVSIGWDTDSGTALADQTVALLSGHGTNRFSLESDAALVHISENGRFEWEVGFTSGDAYNKFIGYQKGSAEGRSFDFRNFGQSVYADSVVIFSSDTDAVDLVRFDKVTGSTRTTRAKVDALGKFTGTGVAISGNAGTVQGVAGHYPNATFPTARTFNSASGSNDLYTVPTGRKAFVQDYWVTNSTGGSISHFPKIKISGTYYQFGKSVSESSGGIGHNYGMNGTNCNPIVMNAGEILSIDVSATGLTIWASIIEFNASSTINRADLRSFSAGNNTLFTMPSGANVFFGVPGFAPNNNPAMSHTGYSYFNKSGGSRTISGVWVVPSAGATSTANQIVGSNTVIDGSNFCKFFPGNLTAGDTVVLNTDANTAGQFAWINYTQV